MSARNRKGRRRRPERSANEILAEARRRGQSSDVREGHVPEWILEAVREDEARARPGRMPLTGIRPAGRPLEDTVVVVRLTEFMRHFPVAVAEGGGSGG